MEFRLLKVPENFSEPSVFPSKAFYLFICLFFFFFLAALGSSSLIREGTQASCFGSTVLTSGPPGKSPDRLLRCQD